MSEEELKYAFDRFYQGEEHHLKGTGIGLALSSEFIKLMDGQIELFFQNRSWNSFHD